MKELKMKYILLIAMILFFAIGCVKENVDVTPPSMTVISYLPTPLEDEICSSQEPVVFQLIGGDELTFDVVFDDNEGLSQYKVDIHNNFDCHGHGGGVAPSIATPNVDNQTTDWTILEIQDISGTSMPVQRMLNVPENVTAGNYHFHIQVIDEAGNDSPFANFFSLKIKNPVDDVPPQINIQEPTSSSFSIKKGEVVNFVGQVTDNRSLSDGGNGVLYLAYTDLSSGNTFTTNQVFAFDTNIDTDYNFDFEYTIPQTLVAGNYRLSLGA
ncbi:MAG: DUF4625 domain-containing protein, partial [Chitinophagales bacterium]